MVRRVMGEHVEDRAVGGPSGIRHSGPPRSPAYPLDIGIRPESNTRSDLANPGSTPLFAGPWASVRAQSRFGSAGAVALVRSVPIGPDQSFPSRKSRPGSGPAGPSCPDQTAPSQDRGGPCRGDLHAASR